MREIPPLRTPAMRPIELVQRWTTPINEKYSSIKDATDGLQGENIHAHKIRRFQKVTGHQDMLAHSEGAKAEAHYRLVRQQF